MYKHSFSLCVFAVICNGYLSEPVDPGFDLFFETNLEEMNDIPIKFDSPVPQWIKGTLVRNTLEKVLSW